MILLTLTRVEFIKTVVLYRIQEGLDVAT